MALGNFSTTFSPISCFPTLRIGRPHRNRKELLKWKSTRQNKRAMMALGRSPEYHRNQIILKSVHQFSRRSHLKFFFLFIALVAILFNRVELSEQFLYTFTEGTFLYNYFKIHALAKEEKSSEGFSIFSSGSHLVQLYKTV